MTASIRGKVTDRTAAQNRLLATARPIPSSMGKSASVIYGNSQMIVPRWLNGKTSAEKVNGTGPSPVE